MRRIAVGWSNSTATTAPQHPAVVFVVAVGPAKHPTMDWLLTERRHSNNYSMALLELVPLSQRKKQEIKRGST